MSELCIIGARRRLGPTAGPQPVAHIPGSNSEQSACNATLGETASTFGSLLQERLAVYLGCDVRASRADAHSAEQPSGRSAYRFRLVETISGAEAEFGLDATATAALLGVVLGGGAFEAGPLTEIECDLLDAVFEPLARVWNELPETVGRILLARSPAGRKAPLSGPGILFEGSLRVGEAQGFWSFWIPQVVAARLEPVHAERQSSKPDSEVMLEALREAAVDGQAALLGPRFSVRQLAALKPGDVLSFSHSTDAPLTLALNGSVRFEGRIVRSALKRCFHIDGQHNEL